MLEVDCPKRYRIFSLIYLNKLNLNYNNRYMKKVILTYGTFDTLHYGHINLLKRAKKYGDFLIVFLSTDKFNKIKGKKSIHRYKTRKKMLEEIRCVDLVLPEMSWNQKIDDFRKYNAKYIIMGDDWKNDDNFKKIENYVSLKFLKRTPNISSTKIKKILPK